MQRPRRDTHEGDNTWQDRRNQHNRLLAALPQRCHPPRSYGTDPRSAGYAIGAAYSGHPCGAGCRAPRVLRLGGECQWRRGSVDLDTGRAGRVGRTVPRASMATPSARGRTYPAPQGMPACHTPRHCGESTAAQALLRTTCDRAAAPMQAPRLYRHICGDCN